MNKTRLSAFRWEVTNLNAHLRSFIYTPCLSRSGLLTGTVAATATTATSLTSSERLLEFCRGGV